MVEVHVFIVNSTKEIGTIVDPVVVIATEHGLEVDVDKMVGVVVAVPDPIRIMLLCFKAVKEPKETMQAIVLG